MVQRPTERKCEFCGRPLSIYNRGDICHFHVLLPDKKPKHRSDDLYYHFRLAHKGGSIARYV